MTACQVPANTRTPPSQQEAQRLEVRQVVDDLHQSRGLIASHLVPALHLLGHPFATWFVHAAETTETGPEEPVSSSG